MPELTTPLSLGEIAVPAGTRLRTIARAAGISISLLREYNPQILRDRVPPMGGDYLVALPEGRVQRALAAFPAYSDQEVVAESDEPSDPGEPVVPAVEGLDRFVIEPDADEPLPRRPVALGRNRLPSFALPGREQALVGPESLSVSVLSAKLPTSLAIPDIGWRRSYMADPLGVLASDRSAQVAAKVGDTQIQKQLGFLHEGASVEALRAFPLGNGITVRVRRDKGAHGTAITVRVATVRDPDSAPFGRHKRGAEAGSVESLHTITVDNADADAGVELAATRLRLALGDTSAAELAEIRFRAGSARRKELQKTQYGSAWIALGEALFPPDHPLAGTVLGASSDGNALRQMMVAEAMRREHAVARASITVVGDVDELRVKKLAEGFLASVNAPMETPVVAHPRDDRLTVEDAVGAPRLLVGWIGPGEGEVGDASLRVLMEMLENPKTALLSSALGDASSQARAEIEIWPRASVPTIEISPTREPHEALAKLDAELERLATEGPDAKSLAIAKWILHARLTREIAAASAKPLGAEVHSAGLARLRHALRPWAAERALQAIDEVSVSSVRAVIRRVLSPEHRVVVTTVPRELPR
jgi:membrane-bound lytic murein transglycosylase D